MKTITASKFRAQFSELVKGLETGPITITKHGKAIAILTGPSEASAGLPQPSATTGPSEAFEAATDATEAEKTLHDIAAWTQENNVLIKDAETQARINSFGESEEEKEEGEDWSIHDDKAFENYLSEIEPDYPALTPNYSC
jgi:prevent-host-death family protein